MQEPVPVREDALQETPMTRSFSLTAIGSLRTASMHDSARPMLNPPERLTVKR